MAFETQDTSVKKNDFFLRPSGLSSFLMCPKAYQLERDAVPLGTSRSIATLEGTAIHRVMQEINERYLATQGIYPKAEEMVEFYSQVLGNLLTQNSYLFSSEQHMAEEVVVIAKRAAYYIPHYLRYYAPQITPVEVEKEVQGTIGGIKVVGHIDLIRKDEDGNLVIVDYKTGKQAKSEGTLDSDLQMGAYAILTGIHQVEYISFVKTKEPKIDRIRLTRTPHSLRRVVGSVQSISEMIDKGIFPYADPTSWKCTSIQCQVWDLCPQGGKETEEQQGFTV